MQIRNKLVFFLLLAAMLLASCTPAGETSQPTQEGPKPYPVEPSETSGVPNPYPMPSPTPSTIPLVPVSGLNGKQPYVADPQVAASDLEKIAKANNAFAMALYQRLAPGQGNMFYSPYSIYQALLMTYAGAREGTAQEMALALGLPEGDPTVHAWMNALNVRLMQSSTPSASGSDTQRLTFKIANALWGQQDFSFNQDFLDTLSANYDAGLKLVDFSQSEQARELINTWVAAQTNDKIKDLIPRGVLDEMTRLVLTNAVYFKGAWQTQFDPNMTHIEPFTQEDGGIKDVPMLRAFNLHASAIQTERLQAVSLPYEGGTYAMLALIPQGGSLADFEAGLSGEWMDSLLTELENQGAAVNLSLPKFKIESSFDLNEALRPLGMVSAFDPNKADFSGMDGKKDLFITALLHKSYVDVNEQGTEAAAATAVVVGTTSMPGVILELKFDHPFLFAIYERGTGTIVFLGRVTNP